MIGFAYSFMIRFFYTLTATPLMPGGFGPIAAGVLFILASFTGCFVFAPGIAEAAAQHMVHAENQETFTQIIRLIAAWLFFYLLHVYIVSFFNRCLEDEKHQPMFSAWLGNTAFVLLLWTAGFGKAGNGTTTQNVMMHPFTVSLLFWGFTVLVACLHLRKNIDTFSIAAIADYQQRHALLRQYKDTDFTKPLLYTDWYQKALNLAQQQVAASRLKNDS